MAEEWTPPLISRFEQRNISKNEVIAHLPFLSTLGVLDPPQASKLIAQLPNVAEYLQGTTFKELQTEVDNKVAPELYLFLYSFSCNLLAAAMVKAQSTQPIAQVVDSDDDPVPADPSQTFGSSTEMEIVDTFQNQSNSPPPEHQDSILDVASSKQKRALKKKERKMRKKAAAAATNISSLTKTVKDGPSFTPSKPSPIPVTSQESARSSQIHVESSAQRRTHMRTSNAQGQQVITGYVPDQNQVMNTVDLLVYDIPAKMTAMELLSTLSEWGLVVSLTQRFHQKYQSIKVKITLNNNFIHAYRSGAWAAPFGNILVRWFPANWSLAERKERERFQAAIVDIPESMTEAALFTSRLDTSSFIAATGAKYYKIITEPNKHRKLIAYFATWDQLQVCCHTPQQWEDYDVNWIRHSSPSVQSRFRQQVKRAFSESKGTGANATPLGQAQPRITKKIPYSQVVKSSVSGQKKNSTPPPKETRQQLNRSSANTGQRKPEMDKLRKILLDLVRTL